MGQNEVVDPETGEITAVKESPVAEESAQGAAAQPGGAEASAKAPRVRRTKAEMAAAREQEAREKARTDAIRAVLENYDGDAETLAELAGSIADKPRDIHHQLLRIQQVLKVGKPNLNEGEKGDSFAYRTLEDIYAELKPVLEDLDCVLSVNAVPTAVGSFVFNVVTATLTNARGESRSAQASAMISPAAGSSKFPSQETLACGTMAAKAAIAGLFLLDNTTKEQQAALGPVIEPDSMRRGGAPAAAPKATATAPAPQPAKSASPAPAAKAEEKAEVKPEAKPEAKAPEAPATQEAPKEEPKTDEAPKGEGEAAPAPAEVKPEEKPAEAQAPEAPAAQEEQPEADFVEGKEVLKVNTPLFQRLGVRAATFHGTADRLIVELRKKYTVSDEVASEFIDSFYCGAVA